MKSYENISRLFFLFFHIHILCDSYHSLLSFSGFSSSLDRFCSDFSLNNELYDSLFFLT